MVYAVNWSTKVVTVPKADLVLVSVSPEIYELDVIEFWKEIHAIQGSEGMPYADIMQSNQPVVISGVTYVRSVEVINGYTVEFENGMHQVNLVGANNNISDVRTPNNVSISSANSAGAAVISPVQDQRLREAHELLSTIEHTFNHRDVMRIILAVLAGKASGAEGASMAFRDVLDTKNRVQAVVDEYGNRTSIALDSTD